MLQNRDNGERARKKLVVVQGRWAALAFGSGLLVACTVQHADRGSGGDAGSERDGGMQRDAGSDTDHDAADADSGAGNGQDGGSGPRAGDRPVLYPGDLRHSPLTPSVAQTLRSILAKGSDTNRKNFIRVGDNLSHASHLLGCFDPKSGETPVLGATVSAEPTLQYFLGGSIQGVSPFAYTVDMESFVPRSVIDGSGGSSWLQQQIELAHPAFALVSFGPIGHAGAGDPNADDYLIVENVGAPMLEIVDTLIAHGTIPLLRSAPPYYGRPQPNMLFSLVNALSRAVAQGRQVPFADPYPEYQKLGAEGYWSDGAHLADYMGNPCDFSVPALAFGDNVMNRSVVEQMHRAKTVLLDSAAVPDADGSTLEGEGTETTPYFARSLPFSDLREFAASGNRSSYSACPSPAGFNGEGPGKNESAGERIYKYTATKATKLRAFVFDRNGSSASSYVHHFIGGLDHCASSHFALLQLEVAAGDHYFVVDASQGTGGTAPAEFGFGLVECDPADTTCVTDLH
ncbi:MAG: hypothetical protein QM778_07260 [Myxococcales bacterium]